MKTIATLKDGRKLEVWSDNTTEETMTLLPIGGNAEFDRAETVKYENIVNLDTNFKLLNRSMLK
jgi:hypothetical protein